jgi:2-iminobutanoate/2-iminopropanoate deaminase
MAPKKKQSPKYRPVARKPARTQSAPLAARQGGWKREGRTYLPPPGRYAALPFSTGVFSGNTFYVAGHIGLVPGTRTVPADPEDEARLLLDGLRATLAQVGLRMDDLVSVQIFCSDVSLFDRFNLIYRAYFTEPLPARAFLGSGPLLFGARFEICAIALKRIADR